MGRKTDASQETSTPGEETQPVGSEIDSNSATSSPGASSHRDRVIAMLTGEAESADPEESGTSQVVEDTELDATDTEEVDDEAAEEADESEADDDGDESEEDSETEDDDAEDDEEDDDSEEDMLDEDLVKFASKRASKRIQSLLKQRDELKPFAEYGQALMQSFTDHQVDAADMEQWIDFGLKVASASTEEEREQYGKRLLAQAQVLGVQPQSATVEVSRDDLKDVLTRLNEKELMLDAGDIDVIAEALEGEIKKRVKAPEPEQNPGQQQSHPRDPRQPQLTSEQQRAMKEVNDYLTGLANEFPMDYERIQKDIVEELSLSAGAHPANWLRLAKRAKELVVARYKRTKKAPPKTPKTRGRRTKKAADTQELRGKARGLAILTGKA